MVDAIRSKSALVTLFANNTTGAISEQDLRDFLHSAMGLVAYVAKTANYTATDDDEVINCDATSGAITITLPVAATTRLGKRYLIVKLDSGGNAVTVDGNGAELLNGAANKSTTTQYAGIEVINNGVGWIANAITGAS